MNYFKMEKQELNHQGALELYITEWWCIVEGALWIRIAAEEDTVGRRMPWDAYWEFVCLENV